jgi:integrase
VTAAAPVARRPRLDGLQRYAAKIVLPKTAGFMEPPERVLEAPEPTSHDVLAELMDGFLLEQYTTSSATGDTYCSCLTVYLGWCSEQGVDPLLITRPQASRFASWLASTPSPDTLRVRGPSRRNQILSACSSLIEYAIDADARPEWSRNPFLKVKRPVVDKHPRSTVRLQVGHVNQLVVAARADHLIGGVLGKLLVAVMARMGLRPGDVCRLNLSGVADDPGGGYELQVPVKGGKTLPRWMPPDMASDFYTYLKLRVEPDLDERPIDPDGTDPLFVHPRRRCRLNPDDLLRLVRRSGVAAGLPFGATLCSRDMRPFFNTLARRLGATLEERKVGLGHSSASTTERYDRTEWAREHDPAIRVTAAFDDYPAEARIGALVPDSSRPPAVRYSGCDCTPVWPELHVDLLPVGVDQTAVCVVTEEPEPGSHRLSPYCKRCRMAYPGPFRVVRVLEDEAGAFLEAARQGLTEAAAYPAAVDRREERRRLDEDEP